MYIKVDTDRKNGDPVVVIINQNGKEYTLRFEERGILVHSMKGVKVVEVDDPDGRWLIIK